jgi:peroxisome-assembly ATPase
LKDYAPPALTSRYFSSQRRLHDDKQPWWSRQKDFESEAELDQKGLVRVKTHAEDLAELTTPKAR